MPPPVRLREPTGFAHLEWVTTDDGSRTLYDCRINETFHSGCGAVAETLIVYLLNSGILQRLRSGTPSVVVEYGLGTATGLLLTAAIAEFARTPLTYIALEQSLLPLPLFRQLNLPAATAQCIGKNLAQPASGPSPEWQAAEFAHLPQLTEMFCEWLAQNEAEKVRPMYSGPISRFVDVRLIVGDIRQAEASLLQAVPAAGCDAIYFDPFSPETNPELWTAEIFRSAGNLLKPAGSLTSYCVKSSIRNELRGCGYEVHKVPGPAGGKREVLRAVKH